MYGLETVWLRKHEQSKLDAFHIRCLRRVHGIAPSFYSRVTNAAVIDVAASTNVSGVRLKRQLLLLGRIARMTSDNVVRSSLFQPGTIMLRRPTGRTPKGRPRQTWAHSVLKHAVAAAGGAVGLASDLSNETCWRGRVKQYVAKQ